jgi:hypothetical protein
MIDSFNVRFITRFPRTNTMLTARLFRAIGREGATVVHPSNN